MKFIGSFGTILTAVQLQRSALGKVETCENLSAGIRDTRIPQ